MKTYSWKAINPKASPEHGTIKAPSPSIAKHLLTQQGMSNILLSSYRANKKTNANEKDRALFFYECAELLIAGLSLHEALITLSKHHHQQALGDMYGSMANNIATGQALSEVCKQYTPFFTDMDIKLIHTAEHTGTLDNVLSALSKHHQEKHTLHRQIKKSLAYPCFLLISSFLMALLLFIFVIPRFESLFNHQNQSLPLLTQEIIAISHHIPSILEIFTLLSITIGGMYYLYYRRFQRVRYWHERLLWRLPIFGQLLKNLALTRMLYVLALTLRSGLPILDAFTHAHALTPSYQLKIALKEIQACASNGQSLGHAFSSRPIFPVKLSQYIALSENTGNIEEMLTQSALHYHKETEYTMGLLKEFAEPFIIAVLGVMIGIIVIAMYLPVFTLGKII